jgi:competence protein ComEA
MNDTTHRPLLSPIRRIAAVIALCALTATLTATWLSSTPAAAGPTATRSAPVTKAAPTGDRAKPSEPSRAGKSRQSLAGKVNLNTATVDQLQLLPGIGPSKAERVIAYRKKNGNFKRVADLRKVKGFGYKSLKKLEPYLDVKGETTLTAN